MKKIIFITCCFMASMLARGQEYLPLLEENKVWSISHEKQTLIGDTIINEITYKKLFFHNYLKELTQDSLKYIAALREDTINKKVYFIWKGFNTEVLLYDFSLDVGDTFEAKSPKFNFSGPEYFDFYPPSRLKVLMVVDSVIGGNSRKVLKLSIIDTFLDYWIEGIGSTYGLFYAGFEMIPDREYPFLLCLHDNGMTVYQENDPFGVNVETCYSEVSTNIKELDKIDLTLSITASFIQERLIVNCDTPLNEITVYSLNGTIIYQHRTSEGFDHHSINTVHWENGIYIIKAGNSSTFASKKIVKL
jgi:hypothetical protein